MGTFKKLFSEWQQTSQDFGRFVESADMDQEIQFEQPGVKYLIPTREIFQTVFNPGSYHRGQIILMLRLVGIQKISQTDYIEWVREEARKGSE